MHPEPSPVTTEADRDELFAALTHRQRRRVLRVLRAAEEPLTLQEVALEVARRTDGEVEADHVERLRATLYHWHAPKLADAGFVEFDRDRNLLSLSESVPAVGPVAVDREPTLE